jgi:hypothetical protein
MSEPDDYNILITPKTQIVTRILHYTHRNGETEPPTVPGEYWFDGAVVYDKGPLSAFSLGTHIRDQVKVEQPRWAQEPGLLVELPWGDLPEYFSPWQVVGRWWGPIVPPWEA